MDRPVRRLALFAAGLVAVFAAHSAAQEPPADPALEQIRKDIFFLASPECEGRGVDTKGIEKAADYVADTFKKAGLKPAMKDGSYFQPFTLTISAKLVGTNTLVLSGPNNTTLEPALNKEFSPTGFSPTAKAKGGLVFVGYGVTAKDLNYDDYAGIDVEGKVVVMIRRVPRPDKLRDGRFDTTAPAGEDSPHAALASKIENAVAHKAAGVILVNDAPAAAKADNLIPFNAHAIGTDPAPFPVLHLKRDTLDKMLTASAGKSLAEVEKAIDADLKPQSRVLLGWKCETEVTTERKEYKVKNVVGVAEGSGPLAEETVVLGAHYDHVGYGNFGSLDGAKGAGKIHFGADDNGSGTTALLELARRYGAMKDRQGRRIVFVAFTAEERGLYGSIHYCKQPPFPLETTAAMINMDMVGRAKPVQTDWLGIAPMKDRLIAYGVGTADGFDKLVDEANKATDFRLYKLATGSGPSDHDSFYRKKVPVLFFYTGTHNEYHRPTDVPEKINVAGIKKVADLVQKLTDHFAAVPTRPKWQATRDPWTDPSDVRTVARPSGPLLRVRLDYNYEGDGVLVEGVVPGGPAEKGGMKDGDLIVEIAGKPTKTVGAYMAAMGGQKSGQPVEVVVMRKGQKVTLKVTPE